MKALPLLVTIAALTFASSARADNASEAKAKFDEGAAAFNLRHYAQAAEAYEEAGRLSPHPAPLVNAAEAWELDGNFVRAARDCDAALRLTADSAITARLSRLLKRVSTLEITGNPNLSFRIDSSESGSAPARVRLSPGSHSVLVTAPATGASQTQSVTLIEGQTHSLTLQTPVAPAKKQDPAGPLAPAVVTTRSGPPVGSWLALGVSATTGIVAIIFGVSTLNAQSKFDSSPTSANADAFERQRTVTNVLVGVTGAAIVIAGVIWIASPKQRATSLSATPLGFSF